MRKRKPHEIGTGVISENTLLDVMKGHVEQAYPDSVLHCWAPSTKSYIPVTYADLVRQAFAFGQRLIDDGVQKQSVCMVACHSPYATLVSFYGAISVSYTHLTLPTKRIV